MNSHPEKFPISQAFLNAAHASDDAFIAEVQISRPLGELIAIVLEHQRSQMELIGATMGRLESRIQAGCEAAGLSETDFQGVKLMSPEKTSE
ncbi:hypothetical protein ACFY5D_21710 [Paeniglutamicibacter sp. NPDC012692]|uniref:hypothetical protein n=1 Tax=Paeniglutamicibacter sp. NPDC012692 TaxID=3364388 RepID=UPI003683C69F